MTRKSTVAITAVVVGIMGYMVYSSVARVQKECEVCIAFAGGRRCARGAGANADEAKRGAQTAVCGVLANGMDEVIRCQNTQPVSVTCS